MSKDMLGPIIREMVRVPRQRLGAILDLANKLAGKDGELWYEKLRTILREPAGIETITVLPGLSLDDRIAAGKYGDVDKDITETNFPHDPQVVGEWEWKLFYFTPTVPSEDAVATIVANGFTSGYLEHVLAFAEQYPQGQHKYPIIALGSSWTLGGGRGGVPTVWCNGPHRDLRLSNWLGGCYDGYLVLAVRKKKTDKNSLVVLEALS